MTTATARRIETAARNFAAYIDDPVMYVQETILPPHKIIDPAVRIEPHQADMMEAVAHHDRVAVKAGNGMGKDTVCAWLLEWFLMTRPLSRVPVTSGVHRQVRSMLWAEVHKWSQRSLAEPYLNIMDTTRVEVKGYNKQWFAEGFTAVRGPKAEGYHAKHMLFIVTEAKAVPHDMWDVIFKACSGEENKVFAQSVPGESVGDFFQIFHTRRRPWKFFSFAAAEKRCDEGHPEADGTCSGACKTSMRYRPSTPLVSQASIDEKLGYGEDSALFQAGALANFVSSDASFAMPLSHVEAAQARWHNAEPDADEPAIIGVDIGQGVAETVIAVRRAMYIYELTAFREANEVKSTATVIAALSGIGNIARVYVDKGGPGWGPADRIKHALPHVSVVGAYATGGERGVVNKRRFHDRTSELWGGIRDACAPGPDGLCLPPDQILAAQLMSRKITTSDLREKVESKEDMAARGLPSPDRADAVALTFWASRPGPRLRMLGIGGPERGERSEPKAATIERDQDEQARILIQSGLMGIFGEE